MGVTGVLEDGRADAAGLDPSVSVADPAVSKLGDIAAAAGLQRIHVVAWRDLDDPEAGGSELHASRIASLWATAGIDVTMRTSRADGLAAELRRDGYRVVRRAGRYRVFPAAALAEVARQTGPRDGLVEIWNGMPFFSPLWCRGPRVVFLHHLHAEMWRMVLPPRLAAAGQFIEQRLAPPFYRRTPVVTLSQSSKQELVERLGFRPDRVATVPPGIDSRFSPAGPRSPVPLVVAVGRLVPVKRFDVLVSVLATLKRDHPALRAVIVGEGYERPRIEEAIRHHEAEDWLALPGHLDDDAVLDLYRRAWAVASASAREGWGMTLTEAAACGTPAVATRIAGHVDAVDHQRTGLLADRPEELREHLHAVLSDARLRERLGARALARASAYTWEATARGTLEVLAAEAQRRRRKGREARSV